MAHQDLWTGGEFVFIGEVMSWAFLDSNTVAALNVMAKNVAIPRDYFIFDVETLGYEPKIPIVQIGWGIVRDAKLTNVESLLLDWSDPHYDMDQDWVRKRIESTTAYMALDGKRFCTTYEQMCSEGIDPIEAIEVLVDLIETYLKAGQYIVGHNAWMFDKKRVDHHAQQFLERTINWGPNAIFDTGLAEKAAQMNRPPYPGETMDDWYSRIYGGRSSIKWSLEPHCVEKYRLVERCGVDPLLAHNAGYDCRMTYHLFESYRQITEAFLG